MIAWFAFITQLVANSCNAWENHWVYKKAIEYIKYYLFLVYLQLSSDHKCIVYLETWGNINNIQIVAIEPR